MTALGQTAAGTVALAFLAACSQPSAAPEPSDPNDPGAPFAEPPQQSDAPRWPPAEGLPGLSKGTQLTVGETRRVEGVEDERSSIRIRWTEVDAQGRGQRAELVVLREERGRGADLRSTPNEGLRFQVAERSGKLRLLSGAEPHWSDETELRAALFARVFASGGHGALRPEEPKAVGESWSVPIGRYLEEAGMAGAPIFEGRVRAWRTADRPEGIAIGFEVLLQSPARFQREASLELRGEAIFHPRLGIAVAKRSAGVLRQEQRTYRIEVETIVDGIVEGDGESDGC